MKRYATSPVRNNPSASSDVPTGRRMNGSEMFMRRGGAQGPGPGIFCLSPRLRPRPRGEGETFGAGLPGWRVLFRILDFGLRISQRRPHGEFGLSRIGHAPLTHPRGEAVEAEVNHRRRVKREELREQQPANNRDAEWTA